MTDVIQQLQEAADKATQASSQAKTWSSGPINTTVPTDSGLVPTIAEFTRANQVRADNAINAIGWVLAGDFTAGCTVTERNQYVLEVGGSTYRWDGTLPKVVPPGSAPSPEAPGSWVRLLFVSDTPPLPDVWAPLSDSLRLITGYGREVKVGEDVVARMVNFSRSTTATYIGKDGQLKTAAVNAPRFEKEGLLIEGQSTNLFLYSKSPDSYPWFGRSDNTSYIKITDGVRITGLGYYTYHALPVIAGQKYTFSVTCKVLSGTLERVGLEGDVYVMLGSGLTPEDGTVRLSGTVTPNVNGHATSVYYPTQNSVVEFTDIQFEALPFASSYIPTNGAAATRAADIMTGLGPGNVPVNAPFSLAAEISVTPVVGVYPVVISMGGLKLEMAEPVAGSQRIVPFMNGNPDGPWLQGNDLFGGGKVLAIACDSSGMLLRYGGKTRAGDGGYIESIGDIDVSYLGVCHIRNFRIWHRALTDEQIKGVA